MRIFWKMIFWLVLKLEISYRVTISWRIFGFFERIFWRLYFCMMKYLSFHNSSFVLLYLLMSMARPQCDTPCFPLEMSLFNATSLKKNDPFWMLPKTSTYHSTIFSGLALGCQIIILFLKSTSTINNNNNNNTNTNNNL